MAREDRIIMSMKEVRRLHILQQVLGRHMTQVEAARVLGLSSRQMRRLVKRVRQEGEHGLIHRSRGEPSNRRIAERLKGKVLKLYEKQYGDFGPTLAAEKLAERDGVTISDETLRGWLLDKGVDHFCRRKRPHRQWRERRGHVGELLQMDGSHHAWLEDRGPACVLLAYIDDASSRVFARFYEYEGTIPAMDSFQRYSQRYGIPMAIYADKHSTYRSPAEPTVEEQLAGVKPMSQCERALAELGVEMIHAQSPQAKGRIERLFKTFQDRLIKEMRLAGVKTMEEANRFLEGYLPIYNQRFEVQPAQAADLHRPIPAGCELDAILCTKTERTVRNDQTVTYRGRLYQIEDRLGSRKVVVEERLDGSMRITAGGKPLHYHEITSRPVRVEETPQKVFRRRRTKPAVDHPWRKAIVRHNGASVAATAT